MQYDRPEIADVWEVFGTLQCKVRNLSLVLRLPNLKKKLREIYYVFVYLSGFFMQAFLVASRHDPIVYPHYLRFSGHYFYKTIVSVKAGAYERREGASN